MFKPLYGLCAKIECGLDETATSVRLQDNASEAICAQLHGGNHSFGILTNGIAHEQVKITCMSGHVLIERGVGARPWSACDKLQFEWTPEALAASVQEAASESGAAALCGIVSDTLDITNPDPCDCEDSCTKRIELKSCDEIPPFVFGTKEYYLEDGCWKIRNADPDMILTDGIYKNATVTVKDGKIIKVSEGTAIVKNSCSPCCD